jgi:prepilin-type N-terminal cleavage/methylation domain-containing protein
MQARPGRRAGRGFTLIELLVAIGISVVLMSILAVVFTTSTAAQRQANTEVSLTERLRSLNLRVRQEIGGMVSAPGPDPGRYARTYPYTYEIRPAFGLNSNVLAFPAATVQDGKSVTVDLAYIFQPGKSPNFEEGRLIRLRDATGPQVGTPGYAVEGTTGKTYALGDDLWIASGLADNRLKAVTLDTFLQGVDKSLKPPDADVMMTNVRSVTFEALDPPPEKDVADRQLNPRTLPAGIKMTITFGPEMGDVTKLRTEEIMFPVPRGL